MEALDNVKKGLRTRLLATIIMAVIVCLQGLFVMIGVSYLFLIGNLLVKMLVLVSGSLVLVLDILEAVRIVKKIGHVRSMLKASETIEKLREINQ